jgi:hypothetical protein
MGDCITFADIAVVSFVGWIPTVMGHDSKERQDMQTWHGGRWKSLVERFERYTMVV